MMNKNVIYYIKGVVALTILVLLAACSPHVENAVEKMRCHQYIPTIPT